MIRKGISVGVVFAVAALAMALAGATSAAGPRPAKANTHAGWAVIKQHGKRNYAGPNCPGKGWNCTTSTRVLQAAAPGGQNVAECSGNGGTIVPGAGTCQITQTGTSNIAKCTQKSSDPSATQSCLISQTGASNNAAVAQTISQSTSAGQLGNQTALVTQAGGSVSNTSKVIQSVSQSVKTTGGGQTENAHQKATVSQAAVGAGVNLSDINQSQAQKAQGGATQSQNATVDASFDCLDGEPAAPNACSNVTQTSAAGKNTSYLGQSIDQDANTGLSPASQTQGTPDGGLEGRVHQETDSGSSYNKVSQDKHQKVNGPKNTIQTQWDPVRCCGTASQIGGTGNLEDINQSASLGASNPGASQHSRLIGESRTPDGTCMISQHASLDTDSANNSENLSPCPLVTLITSCTTSSTDFTAAATTQPDNCFESAPQIGAPDSALQKTVRNGDGSFAEGATANTGDTVEFSLAYSNVGNVDAHSVTLSDVLPAGLSFEDCSPEPVDCSYDGDTNTISWDLGTVPYGDGVTVFFTAGVVEETAGASMTNTANAASKEEGPGAASDTASVTVANPPPLSSLTKGVRPDGSTEPFGPSTGVDSGQTAEYKITYSNSGLGDAHNVVVTDVLPAGATLVSGSCIPTCTVSGSTISWNLGTAVPDNDVDLFFKAVLTTSCSGSAPIINTASADSDEESSVSSNPAAVSVFIIC